jgi:hypothetical protein
MLSKYRSSFLYSFLIYLVGAIFGSSVSGVVIFEDSFTGGDLTKTMSGAKWGGQVNVEVIEVIEVSSVVNEGVVQFSFKGSSDTSSDAFSELRFDLGKLYPEIWLQFYMYIPLNYVHRDAIGSDNNKILRLWGSDYNNVEKIGLSTWPGSSNSSRLIADWNRGGAGIGPKGPEASSFITESDLGKWMKVRFQVIAASSLSSPGSMRVWKNDELIIDHYQAVDNFYSGEPHSYRYGYLMGWSNSGFNELTKINIDGVVFATSKDDFSDSGNLLSPPNPPLQIYVE